MAVMSIYMTYAFYASIISEGFNKHCLNQLNWRVLFFLCVCTHVIRAYVAKVNQKCPSVVNYRKTIVVYLIYLHTNKMTIFLSNPT